MNTDVTTLVIPLRNQTALGRLNNDEALGALNAINSLGWTIGGSGNVANAAWFQPTDGVSNALSTDGCLYTAPYDIARVDGVIRQIRDTYSPAARLTPVEWAGIFVAMINLAGSITVPA